MVVFSILFYFLAGFLLSCLYNLFNLIPPPCDMTEDQKRIMFIIVLAWPLMIVFWIIRETAKTVKWVIDKLKKGNK